MLLRSSSTPLLGSLLPSDSIGKHSPSTLAFHCNTSSPAAPFRRTNSDGNLNTLLYHAPDSKPNPLSRSILQSIPSFSFYGHGHQEEDDYDNQQTDLGDEDEADQCLRIQSRMEPVIASPDKSESSRLVSGDGLGFVGECNQMHLASGIGIGMGGGGGRRWSGGGGGGEEQQGMEDYYKKMIAENPGNALVLSNYAEFLYQWKGDLGGAEEYYGRAILMDSTTDGGILSKYANLVWELHNDQLKASSYFQRALQASPHDCHVQAAYANFLWETKDDENNEHDIVKETATQTCIGAATA